MKPDAILIERGIFAIDLADSIALDFKAGADGLVVGKRLQLVPLGTFHHARYGKFTITEGHISRMVANAERSGMDILLDWEHKSSDPKAPVAERRASGWVAPTSLSVVNGWLTGVPRWTKEAATAIASKSFRWISPEFVFDRLDKLGGGRQGATLLAAGLTNRPFLPGQAGATLSELGDDPPGGDEVDWKKFIKALGLGDDATEEEVAAKLTEAKGEGEGEGEGDQIPESIATKLSEMGWDGEADPVEFIGTLKATEAGTVTIQASELVLLKGTAKKVDDLAKTLGERDAAEAVRLGMAEGKIPPAQEEFWVKFVVDNGAPAFTEYLKTAPVLVDAGEIGSGAGGGEPSMSLDEVEKEIEKLALARVESEKKIGVTISVEDAWELVLSEDTALYERMNQAMVNSVETTPQH